MKSTKNKTFRIQQRNQHLKNILEEGYYIELGTISTKIMEKLIHGELIKLDEVYHEMILTEGIGRITEESKNEEKTEEPETINNNVIKEEEWFPWQSL